MLWVGFNKIEIGQRCGKIACFDICFNKSSFGSLYNYLEIFKDSTMFSQTVMLELTFKN